jgi:hypothetical protein
MCVQECEKLSMTKQNGLLVFGLKVWLIVEICYIYPFDRIDTAELDLEMIKTLVSYVAVHICPPHVWCMVFCMVHVWCMCGVWCM